MRWPLVFQSKNMISFEEGLGILRRWAANGDALKLLFSANGAVIVGAVIAVSEAEVTFTSGGKDFAISLIDTSFRQVPREQVLVASTQSNWDESLELRWKGSGNAALLLRLTPAPAPKQEPN